MVRDPHLARHLAHFGIDVRRARKTDATVAELELAANERLGEWLALTEAHRPLCALYGPSLTGLANLGNSCYINSALQVGFLPACSPIYLPIKQHDVERMLNKQSFEGSVNLSLCIECRCTSLGPIPILKEFRGHAISFQFS